jgi:uncharacterized membrane protein YebE (DUF533 family)
MLKLLIPMAIAALFVHQLAQAQEPGAGVNARQHNQMDRIRGGAASGDLTRGETRGLVGEQRAIRREESAYRSDGVLTGRERADLNRDLDRSSSHIWQQRHDAQQRPNAGGAYDGLTINEREARQREAIRRGIASGELTRQEAGRLRNEQIRIERMEQRARADGNFTPRESARINRQLDNSGRHIQRETHDRQRAGGHDSGWHRGSWQGQRNGNQFGHSQRVPNHGQPSGHFQRSAYQGHGFSHSQPVAHSSPRPGRR